MPVIYEATCSACDYGFHPHSEGYLAIIVDDPCSSMHAHPENPYLVLAGWFALSVFFALGDAILSPIIGWRYQDRVREFDRCLIVPNAGARST
jgi:hypothetical protein